MSMTIGTNSLVAIVGCIAAGAVVVGILGLTQTVSMTTVGAVSVATAFTNLIFGIVQFIFGILGLTHILPMNVVAGVLIATQGLVLVAAVGKILNNFRFNFSQPIDVDFRWGWRTY